MSPARKPAIASAAWSTSIPATNAGGVVAATVTFTCVPSAIGGDRHAAIAFSELPVRSASLGSESETDQPLCQVLRGDDQEVRKPGDLAEGGQAQVDD
jgi:hypothetical protein